MTSLEKLKKAYLTQDWELIASIYYTMTGHKLVAATSLPQPQDNGLAVVKPLINSNDKILVETFKLPHTLSDFDSYGDEQIVQKSLRPPPDMTQIICTSCKQQKQILSKLAIEDEGVVRGLCNECR